MAPITEVIMSIKLLKKVTFMVRQVTGEEFYLAGGCVRDTLYGAEPKDYDAILPCGDMDYAEAFELAEQVAMAFRYYDWKVEVYQSYGMIDGADVNPTSFQSMFLSCVKVSNKHCTIDLLLSKGDNIQRHVLRHDCNMNMVWFDGSIIRWEHGETNAKVTELVFNPDVCQDRQQYMIDKFKMLNSK